jgi:hypothetical protein
MLVFFRISCCFRGLRRFLRMGIDTRLDT